MSRLGVMIATPLQPGAIGPLTELDDRVRLLHDADILPASRWVGDVTGDPGHTRDADGEARWAELLAEADVLFGIPGNTGAGLIETLRAAPRVRWVQARNAGAGEQLSEALAIDADALRDVTVTSMSGIHARPLAEFALLGLLAFAKRLPELARDKAERAWPEAPPPVDTLAGRTVLVVGLGAIGLEVVRLARALDMRVLGVRRTPRETDGVDEVGAPDRVAELAARADAIVVTLPLTDDTEGLVDAATLAALRPGAVVVNVGRGAVIDEEALVAELRDGHLGGACLDVVAREPLPQDSPLWTLDNVILAPHATARTTDEDDRAVALFAENLRRRLDGEPLRNRVDPGQGY